MLEEKKVPCLEGNQYKNYIQLLRKQARKKKVLREKPHQQEFWIM